MLRPGASTVAGDGLRHQQSDVAQWVERFCEGSYGPRGGAKLVDGTWLESAASSLRELGPTGPLLAPYVRLAEGVARATGDQATGALLLAAGTVRRTLALGPRMVKQADTALPLVRRQALGVLDALARPDPDATCLDVVAGPEVAAAVRQGLARHQVLDLDRVEVVVDPHASEAVWHDALWVPAHHPGPVRSEGQVFVLSAGPRPQREVHVRARRPEDLGHLVEEERRLAERWRTALQGALLVACRSDLGDLGEALRGDGVLVWEDVPRDAARRLEDATDARIGTDPWEALPGAGSLRRRRSEGRWLQGRGPAWTLLVHGQGLTASAAQDQADRVLRTAGAWAADPRALPGGGRWQMDVARSLRQAAPLAPGRAPFVFEAVAETLQAMGDRVAAGDAEKQVLDPLAAVRLAVDAALGTARAQLRIDALHRKHPSSTEALRGSMQAPSRERVRAGDVPPLM